MIGDGFNGWIIPDQCRRHAQIETIAKCHSQFRRRQRVEPLMTKRLAGIDLRHVALYETGHNSANLILENQLTLAGEGGFEQLAQLSASRRSRLTAPASRVARVDRFAQFSDPATDFTDKSCGCHAIHQPVIKTQCQVHRPARARSWSSPHEK